VGLAVAWADGKQARYAVRLLIRGWTLGLERFKAAQDQPDSGFESALAEMQAGHKQGHWIWYVFPQLSGLGTSSLSQRYGISDLAEAAEYLRDPVLCSRLLMITSTVAERVTRKKGVSLQTLMGSPLDARKLVSSLTLFGSLAKKLHASEGLEQHQSLARIAEEVLAVAALEGYPPCQYTIARLGS
jgi:uncharacterized protein (DUF1810 family)